MTAVPRDPVFWKRFSTAAHMDMEKANAVGSPHGTAAESQSWLDQQYKKRTRSRCCLCASSLALLGGIVLIVLVLLYFNEHGWYMHGEQFSFP